jgi:hypothetical protein
VAVAVAGADRERIEAKVRDVYAALFSGDEQAYRAQFSPDVVWHVPGDNPVSGEYRGADYFDVMPTRMAPLDDWHMDVLDVLVNERASAAVVRFHLRGRRRGRVVDLDGCHLIRLDEAGRVLEGWGFTDDQAELDAFFSA